METIEKILRETNENNQQNVNWTKAWSGKYPILKQYQDVVDVERYASKIHELMECIQKDYEYSKQDAMLVLKDILWHEFKDK